MWYLVNAIIFIISMIIFGGTWKNSNDFLMNDHSKQSYALSRSNLSATYPFFSPFVHQCMNNLLNQDNIIACLTHQHKPRLAGVNYICNISFQPLQDDSRYLFIKGITQTNWAKLGNHFQVRHFRYQDKIGYTPLRRNS